MLTSHSVEWEIGGEVGVGVTIGEGVVPGGVNLNAALDTHLRAGAEQGIQQSTAWDLPAKPNTVMEYTIMWRELWQPGYIEVRFADESVERINVRYRAGIQSEIIEQQELSCDSGQSATPQADVTPHTPTSPPIPPTDTPIPLTDTPIPPPPVPPTDTPKLVEPLIGKIAFPVYQGNQKHIYLAELDGGEPTVKRLTRDASEPALSPDGSQIAFRSWNDATRGLMVMNVNDTYPCRVSRALEDACPYWAQEESLVFHSKNEMVDSVQGMLRGTDPAYGQYPAWVPDRRIVYKYFVRAGNFLGLYIMNLDGSNPMPITDHPGDTMPSVSPHGDKVAFMSDRTGKWEVYVVHINGTGLKQLTDSGDYNSGLPTWSPDGRYIAFVSDRGNQWAIWVIKSDSSGERTLFDLDGTLTWGERISWSP
jgi:TolB protein